MLLMEMCYFYFSISKHYFFYAYRSTVNSIKPRTATILGYDNQHIFETKIFFFVCTTEFDTRGNLFFVGGKKTLNLVYAGLNQWNLLWLSLLLRLKSKLRHRERGSEMERERERMCVSVCVCVCGTSRDTQNYRIFFKELITLPPSLSAYR